MFRGRFCGLICGVCRSLYVTCNTFLIKAFHKPNFVKCRLTNLLSRFAENTVLDQGILCVVVILEGSLIAFVLRYHFKAHPVNHKVFEAPSLPKVIPKQPTVVEEFNLQPQRSASMEDVRGGEKDAPEDKYEFHARPVNRKILAGPVVSTFYCYRR